MIDSLYFHQRQPSDGDPGGVTVSKTESLPDGDFRITEFCWPGVTLWFIDDQNFTADEREAARLAVCETPLFVLAELLPQ